MSKQGYMTTYSLVTGYFSGQSSWAQPWSAFFLASQHTKPKDKLHH